MAETAIESDPLFTLLTDALRAGPGSPQWSQAVSAIKGRGDSASEYQALITARDNLESGKEYRSVRAGAGFTRKVMKQLDESAAPDSPSGLPTTTWVAALSAVAIVLVLGFIAYLLIPSEIPTPGLDELKGTYFATSMQTLKFDGPLPADWKTIGTAPLDPTNTLRVRNTGAKNETVAGGIYWTTPLAADQPAAVEASIKSNRPAEDLTVQLFITDRPDFSPDRATTSHELVWQLKGQTAQVFLPTGISEGAVERSKDLKDRTVRVVFNKDLVMVDMNGKRLWAGPHQLAPDQPRYVGVRFIRSGPEKSDSIVVTSLKVMKP